MKKILMALVLTSVSMASFAQDDNSAAAPNEKFSVATNSFWSNWFFQASLTGTAFYSNEEKPAEYSKSPFKSFRNSLGFSVGIGKWFTPGIGVRTKFSGVWGKSVLGYYPPYNQKTTYGDARVGRITTPGDQYKNNIKYWNLQEQAMFNLSNLFYGASDTRVWNLIPYFGAGVVRNCSYNTYELACSFGLINTWKISRKLLFTVDLGYDIMGDDFEGEGNVWGGHNQANHDHLFAASVGITYNLGQAQWKKTPDCDALNNLHQSQLDALNAQIADLQAENLNLRNRAPETITETQVVRDTMVINQSFHDFITTPVSVFFDLAKINVGNLKDLVNVQALAKYARENNSKILVTGYADSSTGTPEINERLSLQRAETVKGELIKMGVPAENIRCTHNGGVNLLGQKAPKEFDRRATVQIVEE